MIRPRRTKLGCVRTDPFPHRSRLQALNAQSVLFVGVVHIFSMCVLFLFFVLACVLASGVAFGYRRSLLLAVGGKKYFYRRNTSVFSWSFVISAVLPLQSIDKFSSPFFSSRNGFTPDVHLNDFPVLACPLPVAPLPPPPPPCTTLPVSSLSPSDLHLWRCFRLSRPERVLHRDAEGVGAVVPPGARGALGSHGKQARRRSCRRLRRRRQGCLPEQRRRWLRRARLICGLVGLVECITLLFCRCPVLCGPPGALGGGGCGRSEKVVLVALFISLQRAIGNCCLDETRSLFQISVDRCFGSP